MPVLETASFADLQTGENRFLLLHSSAVKLDLPDGSVDYIVTDPPYFDSVQYSDLAAFFRVWLRQLLPEGADWQVELAETAVDPREKGNGQYAAVLRDIFRECARLLDPQNGRLIFTFHHWNPRGWAALTNALAAARFQLVNRYVVHAENPISVHIVNQNGLLHDVILVLAPAGARNVEVPDWELPDKIDTSASQPFCRDCGTAVGWFLQQQLDTAA
jgi:putative DNA methylase